MSKSLPATVFYEMLRLNLLAIIILFAGLLNAQPPEGYYNDADGLKGEALQAALHDIIKGHTVETYSDIWEHFETTDLKSNGKIWCMYSDIPGNPPYEYTFDDDQCGAGGVSEEGQCYNREHSFPRSWYTTGGDEVLPMHTDLFHVYPTDAYVNNLRSFYPFGEVSEPTAITQNGSRRGPNSTWGYTGTVFEPKDDYKGDFARTMFYMVTRYYDQVSGWPASSTYGDLVLDGSSHPALKEWYLVLLINWHLQDPVSQKEIDRNNAIYAIQGNRNPFIDNPEYVMDIWGVDPETEPESHVTSFSANSITLSWSDATGPVTPAAYLVRMSNTGFEDIAAPENGIPVHDDFWNKNVSYGSQTVTFGGLDPGATYFFKMFGYNGSGSAIIYKTDGPVPQVSLQAN